MLKWFVKRFLLSHINNLLERHEDDVSGVKETLKLWIARLDKILFLTRSMLDKLEDNIIDSDELEQTTHEIEEVIKAW